MIQRAAIFRAVNWRRWGFVMTLLAFSVAVSLAGGKVRLTYDSHDYLAASESIEKYLHGKNIDGVPYTHRLPLLPALLSLFHDQPNGARIINAISLFASLCISYLIIAHLFDSFYAHVLVMTALAFSYSWLQNHFFLWAEPLFTTVILAATFCLLTGRVFFVVLLLCIVAFLIKASGLFLAIGVSLVYARQRQWKNVLILLFSMAILLFAWEFVSVSNSSSSRSGAIIADQIGLSRVHYIDALTSWFVPRLVPLWLRVLLLIATVLMFFVFRFRRSMSYMRESNAGIIWLVCITYITCYVVFFGVPEYFEAERYLSVVLPLIIIACFHLAFSGTNKQDNPVNDRLIAVIAGVWCLYPILRTVNHLLL
jgi:hypothetical protein